jgi:hypothetical protein
MVVLRILLSAVSRRPGISGARVSPLWAAGFALHLDCDWNRSSLVPGRAPQPCRSSDPGPLVLQRGRKRLRNSCPGHASTGEESPSLRQR